MPARLVTVFFCLYEATSQLGVWLCSFNVWTFQSSKTDVIVPNQFGLGCSCVQADTDTLSGLSLRPYIIASRGKVTICVKGHHPATPIPQMLDTARRNSEIDENWQYHEGTRRYKTTLSILASKLLAPVARQFAGSVAFPLQMNCSRVQMESS